MVEDRVIGGVHGGLRQRRVGEKNEPIARAAEGELQTGERQPDLTGLRGKPHVGARETDDARTSPAGKRGMKSPALKGTVGRCGSSGVQGRQT